MDSAYYTRVTVFFIWNKQNNYQSFLTVFKWSQILGCSIKNDPRNWLWKQSGGTLSPFVITHWSNSYSLLKQNHSVNLWQLRFNICIFMTIIRLHHETVQYWKEQECLVYIEVYFQCSDLCLNVLNVLSFSVEYTCISKTFPLVYSWQVYSLVSDLFP